jgi:hypothetical protein
MESKQIGEKHIPKPTNLKLFKSIEQKPMDLDGSVHSKPPINVGYHDMFLWIFNNISKQCKTMQNTLPIPN